MVLKYLAIKPCMHFCQIHKMHNQPTLGQKLSIPNIKQMRIKCNQTIKLLRIIAHTDWGADKKKKIYGCLIQWKLKTASDMEQPENHLLETLHYLRLRIALEAFSTSLIESLYIKAYEPPLSLRRYKLVLQYYTKLISCPPQNPVYNCIIRYKKPF